MSNSDKIDFETLSSEIQSFYNFHGVQLISCGFPANNQTVEKLYNLLVHKVFDFGLNAKVELKAESEVYLIDHAITFRINEYRKLLAENPNVFSRVSSICKYGSKKLDLPGIEHNAQKGCYEFDFQEIDDPLTLPIEEDCVSLSLYGNQICEISLIENLLEKFPKIKALWLNENPLSEVEVQSLPKKFKNLELLNSRFTENSTEWALLFASFKMNIEKAFEKNPEKVKVLNISSRNFKILPAQIFSKFPGIRKLVILEENIDEKDFPHLTEICKNLPKLREIQVENEFAEKMILFGKSIAHICPKFRFINSFDVFYCENTSHMDFQIETTIRNSYQFINSYRLVTPEKYDESSIWFLMDELGSAFLHSDNPNFKVVPFLYAPNNQIDDHLIAYSLAWPIKDIKAEEILTRDFLLGITEDKRRSARLSVWFNTPKAYFKALYKQQKADLESKNQIGRLLSQSLLQYSSPNLPPTPEILKSKETLKIISDSEQLRENLSSGRYEFTEKLEEADILWKEKDAEFPENLSYFINQFPQESCITFKNNLFKLVNSALGKVAWLPATYDLDTNADGFLGHFAVNEAKGKDNSWIVKPVNMARSIDTYVTTCAEKVLRLMETGPKIASKYIHRPLTIQGHKLDFRMLLLIRSTDPLVVYLFNEFWVMNYTTGVKKPAYLAKEFLEDFEKEYGIEKWELIWKGVFDMAKELSFAIKNKCPLMNHPNSRAMYGVDFMIDKRKMQPLLLEITFQPDCIRAAKGIPTFWEDVLDCLFRDKPNENVLRVL